MSQENYCVFYKQENTNEFYCYYPLTKEKEIMKIPDLTAHRIEILAGYIKDSDKHKPDNIFKKLKQYNKDIMPQINELKEDELKICFLERYGSSTCYNTLNYVTERFFNRFCKKKTEHFEHIDYVESKYIKLCYNSGLMYISEKYKNKNLMEKNIEHTESFGYDMKACYQQNLTEINISSKKGTEQQIKSLNYKKLQHGYYNVSITTSDKEGNLIKDSKINKLFSFSVNNWYTNCQIKHARELQNEYGIINIELVINEDKPNCYLYENKDLVRGGNVFYLWNKKLLELKEKYPKNKLVKYMGSYLWGILTKKNIVRKTLEQIKDENINFENGDYEFYEQYYDKEGNIKYIEMINRKQPYKHNMRIMPHLTSLGRIKTSELAMKDLKHAFRIQTDNVTFRVEHKELESENLKLEGKTTGKIKWISLNRCFHLCESCNKYYDYNEGCNCEE